MSATSRHSLQPSVSAVWPCASPASISTAEPPISTACTAYARGSRRWRAGWRCNTRLADSPPAPADVVSSARRPAALLPVPGSGVRLGLVALLAHGLRKDPHGDHGEDAEAHHEPEESAIAGRPLPIGKRHRHH